MTTDAQYRDIANSLTDALKRNRDLFAAFSTAAEEASRNITQLLQSLEEAVGEQDSQESVEQLPQRVAEDLTLLLRQHLTAFATVTRRQPAEVAVTTKYRECLHRAAVEVAGRVVDLESIDRFWGLPVVVDDTIPDQPGFEIR